MARTACIIRLFHPPDRNQVRRVETVAGLARWRCRNAGGGDDLWLQDGAGVILHITAQREGLMLSLGHDAIAISMQQP